MNYQRIYNQIIERAKTRQLEGYVEKHHIIPRCLGGLDDKENIVKYLTHLLQNINDYIDNKKYKKS